MLSDLRAIQKGDAVTPDCSPGEHLGRKGVQYEPGHQKSIKESWCCVQWRRCMYQDTLVYNRQVASRADISTTTDKGHWDATYLLSTDCSICHWRPNKFRHFNVEERFEPATVNFEKENKPVIRINPHKDASALYYKSVEPNGHKSLVQQVGGF